MTAAPAIPATAAPILVAGSVALDSIETPFTVRDDVLGGAATHFSAAASLFAPVRLVGVVGADFPMAELDFLRRRGVDLSGIEVAAGPSFRWRGRYHLDMDHRDTLDLQLGVFASFRPTLPPAFRDSPVLFLANVDPEVQLHVLGQAGGVRLVACDTIDHWINEKRERIDELFSRVDLVFLNEDEARLYADTPNLHVAAARILDRGCRAVCLKKGENGALAYLRDASGVTSLFACPAYPLESVVDPTGAGDAFAGGVLGYLARHGDFNLHRFRQGVTYGTVMASFNVEAFGPASLERLTPADVQARAQQLRRMLELELAEL
ncbi:MAG TPA: PfkB family carbohydrate kinase [Candidatus Dormibacteraeota bacterium]|jgi:sugar/nucleoside kinase (ribokinase family)|nr:PfkB family carbohydrate kinase [Candidatus Dormibacteraeota bacterium]